MKPIDRMFESVEWDEHGKPEDWDGKMLYAVKTGFLKIGELEIECAVLNDGQCIFTEEGMKKFFGQDGIFFKTEAK